ncbi:MAG: U32 family peptidase [Nanoarchaeota archaeon]|nr:U32 family peptidase [Nanoarchaeota archaeon]
MINKYELLAPVGDFKMLHSAIMAGADAIYLGLKEFNMRHAAKNFRLSDLVKIKKICNASPRKPKIYLTINTIIYDNELKKLEKKFQKFKGNINAIICWDLSVIKLCNKYRIPFHVSTQASISNSLSAEFYKKLGAEKVVLARELNLKQIKKISKTIDTECFIHGAMCVSVSGRCFTSQFIYGISANRGQCAHPCRRAWKITDDANHELKLENNRVMSAKDLCTLPFIEKLKKAGIKSFKIEGRNRSPEYVHAVVSAYRKALDKKLSRNEIKESLNELKKVYNRGFSTGFYLKMPTNDDFSFSENGEQTEYKEFIGKIEKYWPKAKAGKIKIVNGKIKLGDEIYILSEKSSIQRVKIQSIEKENKKIDIAKKGDVVAIFLPKCFKGDEVYLIKIK